MRARFGDGNFCTARVAFYVNPVCSKPIGVMKKFCTDDRVQGSQTAGIDQKRANQRELIRGDSVPQRTKLVV